MHHKYILFVLGLFLQTQFVHAQELSFSDSISRYNKQRITKNVTGMKVLGSWGLANVAAGGIGYFSAKQDQWKYFHAMNAGLGVLNTVAAIAGLERAGRQIHEKLNYDQAYDRYRTDKKRYLVHACLDVVFIASGVGITSYAKGNINNPGVFTGLGKSITLQGVFLLVFDNFMYASQLSDNNKWYRIMNEIHFTNSGVGFNYNF